MCNIKYVGMDVHKAITVIVVLNVLGQVESRSQVKTKAENIWRSAKRKPKNSTFSGLERNCLQSMLLSAQIYCWSQIEKHPTPGNL